MYSNQLKYLFIKNNYFLWVPLKYSTFLGQLSSSFFAAHSKKRLASEEGSFCPAFPFCPARTYTWPYTSRISHWRPVRWRRVEEEGGGEGRSRGYANVRLLIFSTVCCCHPDCYIIFEKRTRRAREAELGAWACYGWAGLLHGTHADFFSPQCTTLFQVRQRDQLCQIFRFSPFRPPHPRAQHFFFYRYVPLSSSFLSHLIYLPAIPKLLFNIVHGLKKTITQLVKLQSLVLYKNDSQRIVGTTTIVVALLYYNYICYYHWSNCMFFE